jgi:mannose-6-phosphate isomerase-like protein (cupin superfamily)
MRPVKIGAGLSMQHKHLQFGHGFQLVLDAPKSQAAQMTLAPGESEGGLQNRHRGADQWLFVVGGEGEGRAVVDGASVDLRAGTLLHIGRGETHEIRNTGSEPLQTLNVYLPRAYTVDGNELPAAKS